MRASLRTLCVDDNETNLRILSRTLKHHFAHVVDHGSLVEAGDGKSALLAWKKYRPDMILLDIDMPHGCSGVDVAKEIRRSDPDVIILACTTSDSDEERAVYEAVGMDGCVRKPIDLREMNQLIRDALSRRQDLLLPEDGPPSLTHSKSLPRSKSPQRPTYDKRACTAVQALELSRVAIERAPYSQSDLGSISEDLHSTSLRRQDTCESDHECMSPCTKRIKLEE